MVGIHKQQRHPLNVASWINFPPQFCLFFLCRYFSPTCIHFNKKICLLHDKCGQLAEFLLINNLGDFSTETHSKLMSSLVFLQINKSVLISISTSDCCRCLHKYGKWQYCRTELNKQLSKAEPGSDNNHPHYTSMVKGNTVFLLR